MSKTYFPHYYNTGVCICLLFTRYKKTLSLYDDDGITTKDNPLTSTNPSYVPTSNNPIDNNGSSGTGLYMEINGAYMFHCCFRCVMNLY